jgi:hypothetical protein
MPEIAGDQRDARRPGTIQKRRVKYFAQRKHRLPQPSGRRQFHPCQGGLKGAEKFFLLLDDRVRRGQLLFQSQAGLRLGEAEDALAVQQFDEVELDFIAINHKLIVREIREIATGDRDWPARHFPIVHARRGRPVQNPPR